MNKRKILIYGAYGFTGKLVVKEALMQGLDAVAAGRNQEALKDVASEYKVDFRVFSLEDVSKIINNLHDIHTVIHCAGPFHLTYKPMIDACLATGTHYLDITGEWKVFEAIQKLQPLFLQNGIMVMPGAGFDVVPSDCLANKMKELMPNAQQLMLAFSSVGGSWSGGTLKTMIDGLGDGGKIRIEGKLTTVPYAYKIKRINYGPFETISTTIPWGDISTAWFSTGIPNIEVYLGATESMIKQMKRLNWIAPVLKAGWVRSIMKKQVEKNRHRFEKKTLNIEAKSYFYCKVEDKSGAFVEGRLETINGYLLTAKTAALIAKKCVSENFKPGYQTPASAYGWKLIEEIEESRFF
ncbi:MAG: saccharopine dehydrogenase NADP-binding domain-containing protein [Flavobacteriales bacterium]|nr:saccharopine dehydrogenase NADP-binding domain-containing protein [Flavobacteriales bacterium]